MIRSIPMILVAGLFCPTSAFPQCGTQVLPGYTTPSTLGFDELILSARNFPPALAGTVVAAGELWNNSNCNTSNGNAFPYFVRSGGQYVVQVNWVTGSRPDNACAAFVPSTRVINIYSHTKAPGTLVPCMGHNPDAIAEAIAHEAGHFLGLGDAPSQCSRGMMMSPSDYNHTTGQFTHKAPNSYECDTANRINVTNAEQNPPPPDPFCEAYGCPQSPILIDLDRNGLHLSGLSNPVAFDINADGILDVMAWTQAGEGDAFLALDLNDNEEIDDGGELFGNHTLLANGTKTTNGYLALARYDAGAEGGNGDGFINEADLVYSRLLLWVDADHDGRSSTSELMRVKDTLKRINLRYHESRREDEHGNSFRYVSRALLSPTAGTSGSVLTTDVFFQVQQ